MTPELLNRNISMSIIQSEDHFFADYDKEEPQLWLTVSIIWDDKITRGRNTLTKSLSTWEEDMGTRGRNTWKTLRKYSDIPRYVGRRSFQRKHFKSEQKISFFCAGTNIFSAQVPSQPACGGTGCREMCPVEQLSAGLEDHLQYHLNWNHHHLLHLHHHHRAQLSNYWQVLKIIIAIIILFEIIINMNIFVIIIKIIIIFSAAACPGRSCDWGDGGGAGGKVNHNVHDHLHCHHFHGHLSSA